MWLLYKTYLMFISNVIYFREFIIYLLQIFSFGEKVLIFKEIKIPKSNKKHFLLTSLQVIDRR